MKKLVALIFCLSLLLVGQANAMDVTLAWDPNTETDLGGYKLYYDNDGVAPYNGTGATQGASPIQIPLTAITPSAPLYGVTGLDALKKYYFALTAYDTETIVNESGYSNVVSAGPIQYILTTSVSGTGGTIAPATGAFAVAQVVALTATPNAGYRVKAWTGANTTSNANTNTVTMTANKTITVTFELIAPVAPKNLRVVTVVAQGESIIKLVGDPIPGAEQLKVYVVGDTWRTIPYQEITYKGQQKAEIVPNLGKDLGTKTIYTQAVFQVGESPIVMKKVSHTVNTYEFYDYISIVDKFMWW